MLAMMPVPTKMIRTKSGCGRVQTGVSPFDVYGMTKAQCDWPAGRFIGAELKCTIEEKSSISISPDHGIRPHQLAALEEVAAGGGVARIIWKNGRNIGVLCEDAVIRASIEYTKYLKTRGQDGRASIEWEKFVRIGYRILGGSSVVAWLPVREAHNVFRTRSLLSRSS